MLAFSLSFSQPKPIDVQVITHHMQRYAVWFGGSMLASTVSHTPLHIQPLPSRLICRAADLWSFRFALICDISLI